MAATGGNTCQLSAASSSIDAVFVSKKYTFPTSNLGLSGFGAMFSNASSSAGSTVLDIPTVAGQSLNFYLSSITIPFSASAGVASFDGKFHAAYRDFDHFADFNLPAIGPGNAAYDHMAANGGLGAWTFVAWEDSPYETVSDYNDLVFAVRGVAAAVPEAPASAMLFGGVAALTLLRRRLGTR